MRKKSKYKPRPVIPDTMAWVKGGFRPLVDLKHENAVVRIKNHDAMKALSTGVAERSDIETLISAFNMTEALCLLGLGEDYQDEITEGHNALLAVARRGYASGRFVCTGPELTAMNLTMELHDAQLDMTTVEVLERAMKVVNSVRPQFRKKVVEALHA